MTRSTTIRKQLYNLCAEIRGTWPKYSYPSPWNQPQGRPHTKKWGKFRKPSCLSSYSARIYPEAWHHQWRKSLAAHLIMGIHSWVLHGGGCICILLPNDMGLQDMLHGLLVGWNTANVVISKPLFALDKSQQSDTQHFVPMSRIEMSIVWDEIATMLQITLSFVVVKRQCWLERLWFCKLGLSLPRQPSFNAQERMGRSQRTCTSASPCSSVMCLDCLDVLWVFGMFNDVHHGNRDLIGFDLIPNHSKPFWPYAFHPPAANASGKGTAMALLRFGRLNWACRGFDLLQWHQAETLPTRHWVALGSIECTLQGQHPEVEASGPGRLSGCSKMSSGKKSKCSNIPRLVWHRMEDTMRCEMP